MLKSRVFLKSVAPLALLLVSSAACGGGGSGAAAGQGLVLSSFHQANQANVPINRILQFTFSEAVDVASISSASIQIRQGDAFGLTADGTFRVDGADVYFTSNRLSPRCAAPPTRG